MSPARLILDSASINFYLEHCSLKEQERSNGAEHANDEGGIMTKETRV
jgi:hypothetical protein